MGSKTTLDRITRIEQRIGAVETDHVGVWEVRADETPEQAIERARLAGFRSIGMLAPRDAVDADEWAAQAVERYAREQTKRRE